MRAFVIAFIYRRYRIEVFLSGLNICVAIGWRLQQIGIHFYRSGASFVAKNVVAREIRFRVRRPHHVNECRLSDSREYRLQTRGDRRRERVAGKNIYEWGVISFNFAF